MKYKTLREIIDYVEGSQCVCNAYSSHECGCDADWTPSSVYELQWKLNKLLEYMDNVVTQHKPYDYIQNSFKTIVQEPFTTIDSQGIKNINPKLTPYLTYEKG